MGYRSDVRIVTSNKGFDKLNEFVKNRLKNESYYLLDHLDVDAKDDYQHYFGWNNIKWYYDETDAIMDGLRYLEREDCSYRYARLGESYDDYDEQYYESEFYEDEQDLEYPSLERYFDDDYVIDNLKKQDIDMEV